MDMLGSLRVHVRHIHVNWKIAQAKQRLSEVIRRAEREPQILLNRDKPVAAVVTAQELDRYLAWRDQAAKPTLAESIAEAQRICEEEAYTFEAPPRSDRPNPLLATKRRAPARHQRPQ